MICVTGSHWPSSTGLPVSAVPEAMSLRSWHGKNAPAGTRSFAVTVRDPDAPTGSGWWHWTVVNIASSVFSLPLAREIKTALHCRAERSRAATIFGYAGFGGACPPAGDKPHRYRFTVWALDVPTLPVDAGASGALVGYLLHSHALASAQLTAMAGR
ncbi:YbhB/YbcL family Raf kinase inhibitor-like protein [Klebsiella pneumoniae]|nr:YbhB/YbcL family Raf kinase inhibitor-like protein [Klebsiella pneumoniae]